MLVLTRKNSQTIHISLGSHTAIVHILEAKNMRCSVGIDAGPEFRILRGEVLERIMEQLDQAAESERDEE